MPPPASTWCYPCGEKTPTQHVLRSRGSYARIFGSSPLSPSAKEEGSTQHEARDRRLQVERLLLNFTQMQIDGNRSISI
ncbi:hypothetical protein Y032_0595g428 [Ancylostoma ceylanicum]|uniref:Uncharacterized protein n=1 Tax=Ancylostoma ceylanicum TaxID=53326 RepID=A0A016WNG9_9BILA|nr:hypothetical protein Y032_0595g428 [Ancylostoma ceylanicum]